MPCVYVLCTDAVYLYSLQEVLMTFPTTGTGGGTHMYTLGIAKECLFYWEAVPKPHLV